MEHYTYTADAVDRRMDALRRQLDHAFALERATGFVKDDHVARPGLRPMQAEGKDQIAVVAAGNGHGEVVVDSLFQLVQHGQAVRCGEVHLRLRHRIDRTRRRQWMNRHMDLSIKSHR